MTCIILAEGRRFMQEEETLDFGFGNVRTLTRQSPAVSAFAAKSLLAQSNPRFGTQLPADRVRERKLSPVADLPLQLLVRVARRLRLLVAHGIVFFGLTTGHSYRAGCKVRDVSQNRH